MKIGVSGCSHSSYEWGLPWHHFMGKKLNSEIIYSSSSGAGNEMNIEKIKYILESKQVDLFVYQITDPNRFVIGINNKIKNGEEDLLNSPNSFNNVDYYTFNPHNNRKNLEFIFQKNYDMVDEFIINNVITSFYNSYIKIFHTLLSIKQLCDFHKVKCIFFSWFVDLMKLSYSVGYNKIAKDLNIIDGCVQEFIIENGIPFINEKDFHLGSQSHELIYNNFLHNKILNHI